MRRLLNSYRHLAQIELAMQLQYRVGLAIWMIEIVLEPTIYLVVWQSAAGGGEIGGYAARDFAAYYIVLLVVTHFTQMWQMWEYDWRIRHGELNKALILPIHPIHADITANITFKLLMLVIVIPTVIILSLIFQPLLNPPLWSVLAFIPALLLAGALTFFTGWIVAMAAFWTIRTNAINQMYFLAMLFFSGTIAPLSVLPEALQTAANILPFRWMVAFPVELMLGRLSVETTLTGFGIQIFWVIAMLLLLPWVWRQAVRRYGAVGG